LFGFSMVQMVRAHADKLERPLREQILNLYRPFKWTPCFLHKALEESIKFRKKLSVIIKFEEGCYDTGCQEVNNVMDRHLGNKVVHYFDRVSCCSANITPRGLEDMLSSCSHVKKVYLNREIKALLDVAVPSANADNIQMKGAGRENAMLTGKGVKIAIIDTGVHPHKDLAISDFVDLVNNRTDPYDDNGHGTHCAGDAASRSTVYAGPAPNAVIAGVKVLDKLGSGSLQTVMQGVEWCIQYNENSSANKIDIISMSLGSTAQDFGEEDKDPMVEIVEAAWNAGIVVCVAAGNEGPEGRTIASPGISDQVITVGALDDKDSVETNDDVVASFSSRGPTIYGLSKPDILAPGVNIVSLRAPNSYLDKLQKASRVDNDYFVLSGTSMATPICAGICALLVEQVKAQSREVNPNDIKKWLKSGTVLWNDPAKYSPYIYGAGYVHARNSISLIPPN